MRYMMNIVTTTEKSLDNVEISDKSQLIFIRDTAKIALDWKGNRTFYNDLIILEEDSERDTITKVDGKFYYVKKTHRLWTYVNAWLPITCSDEDTKVIIIDSLPVQGENNKLYVDKTNKEISIWDKDKYMVVADRSDSISNEDIDKLFGGR